MDLIPKVHFKQLLGSERLHLFCLRVKKYEPLDKPWFSEIGLGLTVWHGFFETMEADWLRWCDQGGQLIFTGEERADQEKERADRLEAQLRELGREPGQE